MSTTALGKVYVAIDRDGRQVLESDYDDARRMADTDDDCQDRVANSGIVIAVDLDEMYAQQHTPSIEAAERRWSAAYADLLALQPDARPDDLVLAELVRLRASVTAMTPIVAAACAYTRGLCAAKFRGALIDAAVAYETGTPAEAQGAQPDARPDDLVLAELVRLRAEVALGRAVVDAGKELASNGVFAWPTKRQREAAAPYLEAFREALDAYRAGIVTTLAKGGTR